MIGSDDLGRCPRCQELAPLPDPETGVREVVCHRTCGYCAHPAMDGDVCVICGAQAGEQGWAQAQATTMEEMLPILGWTGGTIHDARREMTRRFGGGNR